MVNIIKLICHVGKKLISNGEDIQHLWYKVAMLIFRLSFPFVPVKPCLAHLPEYFPHIINIGITQCLLDAGI